MRLGLLVDAACDLPLAFIAQNPIRVMPIPIRIGDRELVDVRDEEVTKKFSEHILAAGVTDVEVRPYSEEQLEALFLERLVVDFDYVLCVTITSQRSPIFATAQKFSFQIITKYKAVRQAAGVSGPFAMRVFDSGNMFAAQGVQVMELARMIRADTPVTRIVRRMEEVVAQTYCYIVPADLDYLHARARSHGDRSMGFIGHAVGNALDMKPVVCCFRGETGAVAKVRHFAAAAERVFANVTREIERGLVVPFVNLSYGGNWSSIAQLGGFAALARAASARGVEVHWSHLSMVAGVNVGPGALTVGMVAQQHQFT
jgi:DegV family protein with EDD domain